MPTTPAKPVIPPKPESFSSATLHRPSKSSAENGDARMKRAKSGEILISDLQTASTLAASSKSPVQQHQSPRASKPPAPPIPSPRPLRPLEDGQSADPPLGAAAGKSWAVFDPPPPSFPPPSVPPPPLPLSVRPDSDSFQSTMDINLSVNSTVTRPAPAIPTEAKSSGDAVKSLNGPVVDPLRIDPPKLFSDPVKLGDPIKPVLEPVKVEPLKPVIESVKMEPARLSKPAVEPIKMLSEPPKSVMEPVKVESIKLEPLNSKAALESIKPPAEASKPAVEAVKPFIIQPVKTLMNCIRPAPSVKAAADTSTPIIDPLTQQMKKDNPPADPRVEKNPAGSMAVPVIESLKMRSHQIATNSVSVTSKDSTSTTMSGDLPTSPLMPSAPPMSTAPPMPSAPPFPSEETALIRAKPATSQQRSSILVIDIDSESMDQKSIDNRFTSLHPYSFRDCWEKEVPENETKKQFYWRRFCEIMLMIVTCCIRCFGPV
jgi:hypothetical protein